MIVSVELKLIVATFLPLKEGKEEKRETEKEEASPLLFDRLALHVTQIHKELGARLI